MPDAVRKLRRRLGRPGPAWSQDRLARELNMTKTAIAAWEQGRSEPSPQRCFQLAKLCGGGLAAYFARRGGISVKEGGSIQPAGMHVTGAIRIPDDERVRWHNALDEVLDSGDDDAIRALTHNLQFFERHVGLRARRGSV